MISSWVKQSSFFNERGPPVEHLPGFPASVPAAVATRAFRTVCRTALDKSAGATYL
jgi:hypothetical protein